ncbi:MAG: hypothetical protein MUF37_01775 [Methanoregulaceae archaeon]|nr:hypothetical protein [Methanoregulaceae archaeon]
MKKVTLALVLIAAFCLFAVSPVMAYTWTTTTDPYKASNVTAKYTFGLAGKNVVTFPTATYKPTIASTLDKTFAISGMSTMTTSSGGKYYTAKFPWEL